MNMIVIEYYNNKKLIFIKHRYDKKEYIIKLSHRNKNGKVY